MSTEMNHPEPDLTEFADLVVALEEGRPAPDPRFSEELDQAVADHFPKEWSERSWGESRSGFFAPVKRFFGRIGEYRLPAMAGAAGLAVVIVAVGIGLNQGPGEETTTSENSTTIVDTDAGGPSDDSVGQSESGGSSSGSAGGATAEPEAIVPEGTSTDAFSDSARSIPHLSSKSVGPNAAGIENRKVAQEAEITLGTKPENVQDVSNEIVETVDDHNGIVLDSEVQDGPAGEAAASFSLMIPSTQLESAVAELSGIADLRSRNQETEDITAPTLTTEDKLETARAKVQGLVKELSEATTDEDRAAIEAELSDARFRVSNLTTRLNKLERRANLTPVAVYVETGGDTSSDDDSSWGIGDALDDAGRMLAVAAGVALIALAVAIPIAVLVLIALAFNRAWVRRARKRALDQN